MGVDLYMTRPPCKTCGHEEEHDSFSCTYNLSPIWYAMFPDDENMIPIDGMTGREAIDKLKLAIKYMKKNKAMLENLNPANGWGSYNGLLELLYELIEESEENPDLTWSSWR